MALVAHLILSADPLAVTHFETSSSPIDALSGGGAHARAVDSERDDYSITIREPAEAAVLTTPLTSPFDVTSHFGPRDKPCAECSHDHRGIDLVPGHSDDVRAMAAGIVRTVGVSSTYGNYVVIDHRPTAGEGGTYETLYAHLARNSILVSEGNEMQAGMKIGMAGSTGASTGKHLHLELLIDGQRVNPMILLDLSLRGGRTGGSSK